MMERAGLREFVAGELTQVTQVLWAGTGGLVLAQETQTDDRDADAAHIHDLPRLVSLREVHAANSVQHLQPERRHTHANNLPWLEKLGLCASNAKIMEGRHQPLNVVLSQLDEYIKVTRGAHETVQVHSVATNQQVLNAMLVQ